MLELTIAIPTFDRNATLLRTVEAILPQLTPACRLIILDNKSAIPAEETLRPALDAYPEADCTVLRNPVNIGGDANFLRAFELCETPWLWVLGDDDVVKPDAVAIALDTIRTHPDFVYVNFASEIRPREETFITTGLEEFAERLDSFGNAMFISASLFNRSRLINRLNWGHRYVYSCAPMLLMVILSLGPADRCLFSEKRLVSWEPAPRHQQYSIVAICLGRSTVLELPLPARARAQLGRRIEESAYSLHWFARELYYTGLQSGDFATSRYLYDQLTYRIYYFNRSPLMRLKIWGYRQSLVFPRLFGRLNVWAAALTGRRLNPFEQSPRNE